METSSNTNESPEAKPKQITGHDLSENNASKKTSSYLLKERYDREIPSNQIPNLKKKLTLLITVAIALAAFLMTACDDEPVYGNYTGPTLPPTSPLVIRNMYPSAGAPGSTVAILGENFGTSESDNFVAFGSSYAEILYVTYGVINVRVPMDLQEGDYRISVSSNGQYADAPRVFTVINDPK